MPMIETHPKYKVIPIPEEDRKRLRLAHDDMTYFYKAADRAQSEYYAIVDSLVENKDATYELSSDGNFLLIHSR